MPVIVVVDHRESHRSALASLARSADGDATVRAFADPREALDWVSGNTPDLVIAGFETPGMDGAAFTRRFRERPMCSDVPVIVVTENEDPEIRYRALEAGATDFLLRPFDDHEFRARARNLLILRRQQRLVRARAYALAQELEDANRRHRAALRRSEEKLLRVIDTVPAMISATDSASRLIFVNEVFAAFFGLDTREAVSKPVSEVLGSENGIRHHALDRQLIATGESPASFEETFTGADGRRRVFLTRKVPLRSSGGEAGEVLTISTDITARKEAEQAMRGAKEEAELTNRAKSEFLANMSHELRTPLNAISGFAQMMNNETLGPIGVPKYREYAADILASAEHLLNIINDVLDVAMVESGMVALIEEEFDPGTTIEDVIRLLKARAETSWLRLESNIAPGLPMLRADERRLKQVLVNIVSNALTFTPPGGKVCIAAGTADDGGLRIDVSDTGIGIAEKDLPTVMSRFGRVQSAISRKHLGTGLGVPLSIDLVELHGGTLDISSTVGEGTTVTIVFPRARNVYRTKRA